MVSDMNLLDRKKHFPNNALIIATCQVSIDNDITFESLLDYFLDTLKK